MPRWLVGSTFALFLFCSGAAFGQRDLGTITGTVTDAQGAAIPNAKVTIINDATGVVTNSQSNDAGSYTVPALNPGTYSLTVEASGFQKSEQKGIVVNPGEPVTASIALQVGNASQVCRSDGRGPVAADRVANNRCKFELAAGEPVAIGRPAYFYFPRPFVARRGPCRERCS